jgi:DNA-directed RNA polymerase specialized sigma24 family protein
MSDPVSQPSPGSDAELIKAIESGDAAAYVRLRERHMPAARNLASNLVTDPGEAGQVLSETFARLHGVLRRGAGPKEALRPFLLTALRRVAQELQRAGSQGRGRPVAGDLQRAGSQGRGRPAAGDPQRAGSQGRGRPVAGDPQRAGSERRGQPAADERRQVPDLAEPLLADPATADLGRAPLARAFLALPERHQAVLWLTVIERADPAEAAASLGLAADGVAAVSEQACAAFNGAYLDLHATAVFREDCKEIAGLLGPHLAGAGRGPDGAAVQRHLRGCRDCRAVVVELAALSRSLRRAVAPIFLGPAADAYLAAGEMKPAPTPAITGVLTRLSRLPRQARQAPREQQALAGGVLLLAVLAAAGLSLVLAANGAPQPGAQRPAAAAIAPPRPARVAPSSSSPPAARPVATLRPPEAPSPAPSMLPSPATPPSAQAAPSPAPVPSAVPAPVPPPPPPHRKHRHRISAA